MLKDYRKKHQSKPSKGTVKEYYHYHDESGVTTFRVVRKVDKEGRKAFHQERYVGEPEKYKAGTKGIPKHLYRLPEVMEADVVWIFEGEKDVESFRPFLKSGEAATTNPMGAGKWRDEYGHHLDGKHVIIVEDKDEAGRKHAQTIVNSIAAKAESVKVIEVPGYAKDFTDWLDINLKQVLPLETTPYPLPGLVPVMRGILDYIVDSALSREQKIFSRACHKLVMSFEDFLMMDLPKRDVLMEPWLEESSITIIYGPPGVGKTWLAMEIAAAVANGRDAMAGMWEVEGAQPVLYLDGEMHWEDARKWGQCVGLKESHILSKTFYENHDIEPPFNLMNEDGIRKPLTEVIVEKGIKLVVIDNLFSLFVGIDHNKAEEWDEINQWFLRLRAKGVSVILIHHTGKDEKKGPLGTSAREFNVNYSFGLRKAESSTGEDICAFSINVRKKRKPVPVGNKLFECEDGSWTVTDFATGTSIDAEDRKKWMARWFYEGMTNAAIADRLNVTAQYIGKKRKELVKKKFMKEIPGSKKLAYTEDGRLWVGEEIMFGDGGEDEWGHLVKETADRSRRKSKLNQVS